MKKRKPPIILVTVLVIFAGIAFAYNYSMGVNKSPEALQAEAMAQAQAQAPAPPVGKPMPTVTANDIANKVKAEQKAGPAAGGPKGMMGPNGPGGPVGMRGPSIAPPKAGNFKPTPSDSSVSTQWYSPESQKGNQ